MRKCRLISSACSCILRGNSLTGRVDLLVNVLDDEALFSLTGDADEVSTGLLTAVTCLEPRELEHRKEILAFLERHPAVE